MSIKSFLAVLSAAGLLISTPAHADTTGDVILGVIGGIVINEIVSDRRRDRDRARDYRESDYYRSNQSFDPRSGQMYEGPYDGRGMYIPSPAPRPEWRRCWSTRTYNRHGGTTVRQYCD